MLPVFIACFAAGAVLIGASLVFGGSLSYSLTKEPGKEKDE